MLLQKVRPLSLRRYRSSLVLGHVTSRVLTGSEANQVRGARSACSSYPTDLLSNDQSHAGGSRDRLVYTPSG
jgi:hypothetical protein